MQAIKSNPHRLDVLITDACAVPASNTLDYSVEAAGEPNADVVPKLLQLLLLARGTINLNSASPTGGRMGEGELALAWVPAGWRPGRRDLEGYNEYGGTVFTNAFIQVASELIPSNQSYSPEEFYQDLKETLAEKFDATKEMLKEIGDPSIRQFISNQTTQTLTSFDDRGVAQQGFRP